MELLNQSNVKSITIKKSPKIVKFKASTGAHLYTLVLADLDKAHKLESNIKRKKALFCIYWPVMNYAQYRANSTLSFTAIFVFFEPLITFLLIGLNVKVNVIA